MIDLPRLARRRAATHKGDYGRVLCVAGSVGMTGAAVLTGSAAVRGGAGLVYVALPEPCWQVVATADPCYLTIPLPVDHEGSLHTDAIVSLGQERSRMTVVAIGPGMGQGEGVRAVVERLYDEWEQPLVADADALNVLARRSNWNRPSGPRVMTPHPGEFARLAPDLSADAEGAAALSDRTGTVVVLKGHRTVVTDGSRTYRNSTGNPGMATGGSGDVLTGLIAALIAQGIEPFAAACLGVRLHGRAGDLAAGRVGMVSLCATDLLQELPRAIMEYQQATGE